MVMNMRKHSRVHQQQKYLVAEHTAPRLKMLRGNRARACSKSHRAP